MPEAAPSKKKALIIAISEYDHYNPLQFCKNDGQLMYNTLLELGYEIPQNRKIIGRVDNDTFEKAIKEFFRGDHVNSDDTLLFYYSGHGTPSGEHDYYFVTSETEPHKPDVDGFDYDALTKFSNKSKSKKIVKIIDCCYSGALGKSDENAGALTGKNFIEDKFAAEGEGNYVIASSLGTQESYGRSDSSLSEFTYHISNGLNGSDKDSVDKDGYVTPHSLGKYAWKKMKDLEQDQRPINNTQATGDIFLAEYPKLAMPQSTSALGQSYSDEERNAIKRKTKLTLITITAIIAISISLGVGLITLFDNQPPNIVAPQDITINSTQTLTSVSLGEPGVYDNNDSNPLVTNNASTNKFPIGQTTVMWTAEDTSGNIASDVQIVTINKIIDNSQPYSFVMQWNIDNSSLNKMSANIVSIDSSDNVYVYDSLNHRILKFSTSGNLITEWGSEDRENDDQFGSVSDIAIDSSDNVYVADSQNHNIKKFSTEGEFLKKWGSEGRENEQFHKPVAIAIDSSDNVYVADSLNRHIKKFSTEGEFLKKWGSQGNNDGQFGDLVAIAIDSSDNVYVADPSNDRIQKFSTEGEFLKKWGDTNTGNIKGQFIVGWPNNIAIDSSDNVYVADPSNDRIQKFSTEGEFLEKWSTSNNEDISQFGSVSDIAIDSSDNVYVADPSNDRIQKFSTKGKFLETWDKINNNDEQFHKPVAIAIDSSDNVYVADPSSDRIQKYVLANHCPANAIEEIKSGVCFVNQWGGMNDGEIQIPYSIAIDSSDNVYVGNYYTVQKFSTSGNLITEWGSEDRENDGQFGSVSDIAIDSSDNVYVADSQNHNIKKFSTEGEFLKKWGSQGNNDGQFGDLVAIAIDSSDNVYVADPSNDRIQKFSTEGEFLEKWEPYDDDEQLSRLVGIAIDSSDNVYVVDNHYQRVQKYILTNPCPINTIEIKSGVCFVTQWDGKTISGDGFESLWTVDVDSSNKVYVTDSDKNIVYLFAPT